MAMRVVQAPPPCGNKACAGKQRWLDFYCLENVKQKNRIGKLQDALERALRHVRCNFDPKCCGETINACEKLLAEEDS